jgi:hypothetical protein
MAIKYPQKSFSFHISCSNLARKKVLLLPLSPCSLLFKVFTHWLVQESIGCVNRGKVQSSDYCWQVIENLAGYQQLSKQG